MADTVSTDVLLSGKNRYVVRLVSQSDGTGETDVVKVDRSTLTGPKGAEPTALVVEQILYDVQGFTRVTLEFDGSTDTPIAILSGPGYIDWRPVGGLKDDASGATGDILLTSPATATTGSYDITLWIKLKG